MSDHSHTLIKSMRRRGNGSEGEYAKPFFKWAGGKGQLLHEFNNRLPEGLRSGSLDRYVEPFIGGGAVFLFIMQLVRIRESVICDANEELVLTYSVVKQDAESLILRLSEYQAKYDSRGDAGRKEMFLSVRSSLNAARREFDFSRYHEAWIERASQLLFLNKTCFNGLFRVNSRGEFNVPFGKYSNPTIVDAANLRMASGLLRNTKILHGDFSRCLEYIDNRAFVYLDPPYRPLNETSSFTSYSQGGFTDADQVRLREFYGSADLLGAKVMLSNSDPRNEDPEDHFFDDLYNGYLVERVQAKRFINSDADKRGPISEIIVTNYQDTCHEREKKKI
jgi:DNA adenine methylase